MQWKDWIANPWFALFGAIGSVLGLPGLLFDDAPMWARWVLMNPTLSVYLTGVGSALVFLFLLVKIDQLRQVPDSWLHRALTAVHTTGQDGWKLIGLGTILGISITVLFLWTAGFFGDPQQIPKASPATQDEVIRMMRTLQGYVRNPTLKENPAAMLESALHAKVLAERLQSFGLAPLEGYEVSFNAQGHRVESIHPNNWLTYLTYILPYVEEFGVEHAVEESLRFREEMARSASVDTTQ